MAARRLCRISKKTKGLEEEEEEEEEAGWGGGWRRWRRPTAVEEEAAGAGGRGSTLVCFPGCPKPAKYGILGWDRRTKGGSRQIDPYRVGSNRDRSTLPDKGSIRRAKSKFELKPAESTESHWDRSIPVRLERSNSDPAELGRSTLKTGILGGFQAESDPYLSIRSRIERFLLDPSDSAFHGYTSHAPKIPGICWTPGRLCLSRENRPRPLARGVKGGRSCRPESSDRTAPTFRLSHRGTSAHTFNEVGGAQRFSRPTGNSP
ncbi:hypothetical protein Taro_023602 [Colocasia esculenta]|uniref:Uncharacterized protein n=1 Tax=Colocasia esculenta TaxID=4460 RepID=A0A843V481_COLES|nr:hypothetical protein [Colocasia esculenta]